MNFGWKVTKIASVENRGWKGAGVTLDGKRAAICSVMDFETLTPVGEIFVEIPDDVGVDSEQLTAQQSRLPKAAALASLLLALSQHFIISSFGECKGVPDTMPAESAKSRDSNVSRFTIQKDYSFCSQLKSTRIFIEQPHFTGGARG